LRSPANDALLPVNEKKGKGTGMGTLMPTWFKCSEELLSIRVTLSKYIY